MANLFKSKKQREKDQHKDRRRAFRQAEKSIDDVKDRIRQLDKTAKKQWTEAREALKAGQKAAANRQLNSYRAAQVLMTKLEQKRWVFEQYITKMEVASSDAEFANALAAVNKVTMIDPERVADVFEESQDLLGEQMDSDRFWGKLYEKEMDGAGAALEDYIPSLDELSTQLEAEAAAEVGGGAVAEAGGKVDQSIAAGRSRVEELLNGK